MTVATASFIGNEQIKQFQERGYFILPAALSQNTLEALRGEAQFFVDQSDAEMDKLGVDHIGITWKGSRYFISQKAEQRPGMMEFLYSQIMADVCRATLGPNVWLFNEQWVIKAAEKGMKFSWHQDSGYVGHEHKPYLTCWIPLDDVDEKNGTIYVLPFDRHPETRSINQHTQEKETNDLVGYHGEDPGVPVVCPAGSIVAFSSRLFHRSGANTTKAWRRVYLPQYSGEIITSADGQKIWARSNPFLKNGRIVADHSPEPLKRLTV